ncbi:MAG: signal peptidase I [Candidatus Buchananbacteria bacterium]|jgi:signal peptidase
MKKTLKIFEYVAYAVIAIVAIVLIWSVLPIKDGPKLLVVLSGSMEPAIHTGSIVIVKPEQTYRIGDVITFGKLSKTETPTTHRIYDIRLQEGKPIYVTKGDANNVFDHKEVSAGEIIGKEFLTIPFLGYLIDLARKPIGFMLIIIVPALAIIFDETRKIYAEIKKNKKE